MDEDALSVFEATLDAERRFSCESSSSERHILCIRIHIARCFSKLGRLDETIAIEREVYAREKVLLGPTDDDTLITANNLIYSLIRLKQYVEAKALAREVIPRCRRALGSEDDLTLTFEENYAEALYSDPRASQKEISEAISVLANATSIRSRVFGSLHPQTSGALASLEGARMKREDVAA